MVSWGYFFSTGNAGDFSKKYHKTNLCFYFRPFYPGLVKYMSSGPVVAMCWEGLGAVKTGRVMLGETNPKDSKPGTIRGDFCIEVNLTPALEYF